MTDKYEVRANFMPALLCSAPFAAFGFYFLSTIDPVFINSLLIQTAGGVTTATALYYFQVFMCRHAGKSIEDRIFKHGRNFPSTRFLLNDDISLSPQRKKEIRKKIRDEFGINLNNRTSDTESNRQFIHEAISRIRQKFYKKNDLILQRNIYYGFSRNTAGGALIAVCISILLGLTAWVMNNLPAFQISVVFVCTYAIAAIFCAISIPSNARRYAETLFDEFLAS